MACSDTMGLQNYAKATNVNMSKVILIHYKITSKRGQMARKFPGKDCGKSGNCSISEKWTKHFGNSEEDKWNGNSR